MGERAPGDQGITSLLARQDIWRGRQTRPAGGLVEETFPSGWSALDELLGGGWPREGLVELYADTPAPRLGERPFDRLDRRSLADLRDWFQASLGYGITALLLPWIAGLTQTERVALINPPARPCAERWQREGVDLDKLLLVEPRDMRELGWATEEVLQAGVYPLVLSWLPPLGFALRRRLKLAAESGRSCLVTPYPGRAGDTASPAGVQLAVRRCDGGLAVRRHKPFHPDEARLELAGNTTPLSPEHGSQGPALSIVIQR
ncbi:hypothetical protein LV476_03140 [Guyparkeria hydrothermalis]|uniref:hypothetical protein n=1 Tax=Guyparkeria hydrothermalis TaxID=923 RepID=UPI0020228D4F|nr:hypothetical protein [Guyparkeria hydrothermalis]MCL7743948.1 hypothetical protein [Guyparkeria hydrothermalis]